MKYYPYGTFPEAAPEWFEKELAAAGMNANAIPLWHLDTTENWSVPAAFFLKMPPGYTLFRHGHPCQRFEIVIQGSLDIGDGRTATVGDTFTADANTLYGPHTAGPEGCTTIEVFSAVEGMFRLLYEGPDGQMLEADARKGDVPPDYVPLPGDEEAMLSMSQAKEPTS
jgi:hypothetical protein